MASEAPKVRIVRCPKCFKLLPELANISVYQCGKCGTTLRAKKRKEDQKSEISETLHQTLAQKTENEHDSEDKASTSSSQKALSYSTDGSKQVEHKDFAKVKSSSRRTSNGSTSSDSLKWRENEASSSVAGGSGEDGKHGKGSDLENPSSARQGISGGSNSTSAAQKPLKFNASSLSEELEISEKIVRRYADLIRSKSPVRIAEATNSSIISADNRVSEKLQGGLEASKPSATKTFRASEGSVASDSNSGNQVSDLHSPKSKDSFSGPQWAAVLISSNTGNARDSVNRGKDTEPKVQNVEKKLSSMSSNERHGPVTNYSVISEVDMVTDKHKGELGSSESSVDKVFHAYKDTASSSDGLGDQDLQSRRSRKSSLGSQSVQELVTTTEGAIGRDISGYNRTSTESEVQNQEWEFSLMAVNKKQGPVIDDSIISEDDKILDKHRDENGDSHLSGANTLNAYNDSFSSSDGYCEHDLHSQQCERSFPKSRRVEKVIATNETVIRKDDSVNNMIDTGLEVQNQERSLPLVLVNEKHGQVNGGGDISEDDIVGNKLGGVLEVAKQSATKSFHAYDASISSNDGWGDQVSDVHSHQPRESFDDSHRVAEPVSTNEEVTRDAVLLDNTISMESAIQKHPQRASLMSVKEKHRPIIVGDVSPPEDEIAENTRYPLHDQMNANIPSFKSVQTSFKSTLSWLEEERDGLSMQHFGQRDYENINYPQPQKLETVERNQLELLRRVDELSEQLNRSYAQSRKANERFPTNGNQQERQQQFYPKNHSLPEPDILHQYGLDFPRHSRGTYRPSKSLPYQYAYPLSGNVTNYRNQANCVRSSVYAEELLHSEGQRREYPDHVCYNLYSSGPSSPGRHMHSHYPMRSCEICTVPRDHTDRAHNVENLRRRERRHSVKKHCRPIAGGAPFISCYNCNKLLYLPADSFISSKRRHRLQCSSCSKVLVFSLLRGTHVAPYYQEKAVFGPTEVNSSRGSNSTRNSVFKPRTLDNHGDPLSYSEDAGLSIRDGGSTDGESAERNPALGKQVKKMGNGKENGTRAKKYGNRQVFDSGRLSYNEAESAREGGIATLHQLMGYSTVSRILKASDAL